MVWFRSIARCISRLLCILVIVWIAWWSIRAWKHLRRGEYTFLCTVRYFSLWDIFFLWHAAVHPLLVTPLLLSDAPLLSVSVMREQGSPLWLAVCECRGEGVRANLTWELPKIAKGQTSLHSEYEGRMLKARLIYPFPLALHEGQDLTCVYQFEHGIREERTVHIPRYCEWNKSKNRKRQFSKSHNWKSPSLRASPNWLSDISSVSVLNNTTPLQSRYGGRPVIHRVTLQESHLNRRILLRVDGNVPEYSISCRRWRVIFN